MKWHFENVFFLLKQKTKSLNLRCSAIYFEAKEFERNIYKRDLYLLMFFLFFDSVSVEPSEKKLTTMYWILHVFHVRMGTKQC